MTTDEPTEHASDRGASLVEYALLLALIAVACVVVLGFLGGDVSDLYADSGSAFTP